MELFQGFVLTSLTVTYILSLSSVYADVIITIGQPVVETLTKETIVLQCHIQLQGTNPEVYWNDNRGAFFSYSDALLATGIGHQRYLLWRDGDYYNLNITDVQPSDDGQYQCSVGRTETTSSISKSVLVKVFVKPGRPTITGLRNAAVEPSSKDQPVEIVTISHGAPSAQIKCTIGPAKPAFPLKWFLDGVALTSDISPTVTDVGADKLETTSNILTIDRPGDRFNGAQYKCIADLTQIHLAIIATVPPIETLFNLSVQSPPSSPVIEGGFPEIFKQRGDTVILTCKTIGGNPLPTLQWYRNGISHNHEFNTVEESGEVKSELVISINASDNNAVYRCDAKNTAITEPKSVSVTLKVQFSPDVVIITGHEQVKVGHDITLSCTTSNSNPSATIDWYSRGRNLTNGKETLVKDAAIGGFITQTNITVLASRSDHMADYACHASNTALNKMVSSSIKLDVLYPPDRLTITGFNKSQPVLMDTTHKMTCTSNEGNPLPDLTWYTGSSELATNVGDLWEQNKMRSRELTFTAKPKNNGATFTCTASSIATAEPAKSESVGISVYFPPQNVVITPQQPMKEGVIVTLSCNSGSSNPVSSITWFKNDTELLGSSIQHVLTEDGAFNGKVTVSSYTFTPVASDNGLVILCSARNPEIRRSTTQGMSLNIIHKPIFSGVPTVLQLQEGKNKTDNNFTAVANPPEITYTWFKMIGGVETEIKFAAKRDGSAAELSVTNGILHLTNINRNRAGTYRVKATNSEGTSATDFQIDVQYGASIPNPPRQTNTDSVLELHCLVDANPPIDLSHARWTRLNYNMERATHVVSGTGSTRTLSLIITDVIREDIGTFTCEANNTFGSDSKEYAVNPVAFQPVIDRAPITSKSAAQTHQDGMIKCNLDAFPTPTITWSKGDDPITLDNIKYSMSTKTVGKIQFSFVLTIKSIVESDYGSYKCTAGNTKGSDSHNIILAGTSIPDPPTNITVLNATDSSVILSWVPGFDGGLDQRFNVRYQGSNDLMYADASVPPFAVRGLEPETEYEFTVQAFNDMGKSNYQTVTVSARTLPFDESRASPTAKSKLIKPDEPMFIVIMALAVVGGLLLIVTTVLVCIFVRRRRKRILSEATDSASQSNTTEMYGTHDGSNFQDDAKSYSTYEKGYEDDYARHYEDDDNDANHAKSVIGNGTYITVNAIPYNETPTPPNWSKTEGGNYGAYGRQQSSTFTGPSVDVHYANKLRDATKAMHQPEIYQRPAFVAGRPPAPPPPTTRAVYADVPPLIPDRNYSPLADYQLMSADMCHASYGRTDSTDNQRGHLV